MKLWPTGSTFCVLGRAKFLPHLPNIRLETNIAYEEMQIWIPSGDLVNFAHRSLTTLPTAANHVQCSSFLGKKRCYFLSYTAICSGNDRHSTLQRQLWVC